MSPRHAPKTSDLILPLTPGLAPPDEATAKASRRPFGTVQRQRSGRYQAVHKVSGERYIAPVTFFNKGDASAWLSLRQAEILEYRWKPAPPSEPEHVTFADYSHHRPPRHPPRPRPRRLDNPCRPPAPARPHRSRDAHNRCGHDCVNRQTHRPLPGPARLPHHPRRPGARASSAAATPNTPTTARTGPSTSTQAKPRSSTRATSSTSPATRNKPKPSS